MSTLGERAASVDERDELVVRIATRMEVPGDLILTDLYPRQAFISTERRRLARSLPRKADPSVHRDLRHGWLLPYLWAADCLTWGRWAYWLQAAQAQRLPPGPVPRVPFGAEAGQPAAWAAARRMLERSLDAITPGWGSWSNWQHFTYLLDWLLFGCGHSGTPELPPEPAGCQGASDRLYQLFDASALVLCPADYFGDLLAESQYGRRRGFFPTPHTVAECLALVTFSPEQDHRLERVLEPCVGTGRLLLHASNFSLCLFGADVDGTLIKACLVNGYLDAPWLVRPIPWLDDSSRNPDSAVDEAIAAAAPLAPFATAEADPEAWRFVLIRKRRRDAAVPALQGVLF